MLIVGKVVIKEVIINSGRPMWTCVTEPDCLPANNNKCRVSDLTEFLSEKNINLQ